MSLTKNAVRNNVGGLVAVLAILVAGTWTTVKVTTDHLLYQDATSTARSWATFLAASVTDLEQIADGEQPSAASMAFLQSIRKSGEVFRYEIFNREGYSQLISERGKIAFVDVSEYRADAAHAVTLRKPIVDVKKGESTDLPTLFAHAYVPVLLDGRPIAVVAAYMDLTEQHHNFYSTFLIAAASLCLLTSLAFLIPFIAWYRRTREKQQADRRIRFLAHHDVLTGLANRAQLVEKLETALAVLPLRGGCLAVHFLDVDRFKEVNDTLGHDGGDFLLRTIAERLREIIRVDDFAARLGGDEFIVVQTGIDDRAEAEAFARRLTSALVAPMKFGENEIIATVSVGISVAPLDGADPERLLKSADLALYKSKADGRNCFRFFAPEMDEAMRVRTELEKRVRDAVLNERFILHYQPLFQISNQDLIGFEALIRLPADDGSLIPPLTFIPVAEDMRLIDQIGTWVLREACKTAACWPEPLTVAVNLSPAQFESGNVSTIVARALKDAGLAPGRLELEITESLLLRNTDAVLAELQALKKIGVSIVMDDFGTGYSSLSYLWRFPFDKIKIDRCFMDGMDTSGKNAGTVVKTIIALGRELDMRITVEGVETAQQVAFLDGVNADQVQGYFFGRPMPASEIGAQILKSFRKSHPKRRLALAVRQGMIEASTG
ncbi:EAL domain-containing protein [Bradyrhizobium sp. AUGA SZCCT0222]|uniref:putative bifunctional diguanylate cyclase/phosphodiesterase n=1 Tax=Bradyrhizobium sp. AUGA SZCCT0222 TaxID=2807668 RepID=UPI001BA6D980|nr:EAL domain-containing protein [Bradyrhizobium sp. AUGA SZCCT0222]MBR1272822.1 EAL domain-containing protein [Bradyrhizobium sp. AUGA SZCCT0222]